MKISKSTELPAMPVSKNKPRTVVASQSPKAAAVSTALVPSKVNLQAKAVSGQPDDTAPAAPQPQATTSSAPMGARVMKALRHGAAGVRHGAMLLGSKIYAGLKGLGGAVAKLFGKTDGPQRDMLFPEVEFAPAEKSASRASRAAVLANEPVAYDAFYKGE